MDVMPDDVKPGGELFVRQMQYGKRYCREQLGVDVKVAWLLDTFGHHRQMPQLLRQAGFTSFWFCRAVPNHNLPSEVLRPGLAGTAIPAFTPICQGTYSSRIELKQATRRIEQELLIDEKLRSLAQWLGAPADEAMLWRAWEPVLFNQTHDLASGVMTDDVYDDTMSSYNFSERLAQGKVSFPWQTNASQIDPPGQGTPIVAFNP